MGMSITSTTLNNIRLNDAEEQEKKEKPSSTMSRSGGNTSSAISSDAGAHGDTGGSAHANANGSNAAHGGSRQNAPSLSEHDNSESIRPRAASVTKRDIRSGTTSSCSAAASSGPVNGVSATGAIQSRMSQEDIDHLSRMGNNVTADQPNIHTMASKEAGQILHSLTGQDIDPDNTYVHAFGHYNFNTTASGAASGWAHKGEPETTQTVTAALMRNYDARYTDVSADRVNKETGVYTAGPEAREFNENNEVTGLKPSALRDAIYRADFQSTVDRKNNEFWNRHEHDWSTLSKFDFVSAARDGLDAGAKRDLSKEDLQEGELSPEGYALAMKGAAGNIPEEGPITLDMLKEPDPSVQFNTFDINGYASSDIRRFVSKDNPDGR